MNTSKVRAVCPLDICSGCSACADACPKSCITVVCNKKACQALIEESYCVQCGRCHSVCPSLAADIIQQAPSEYVQGWADNQAIRRTSASGGAASSIMHSFISSGGVVCSCVQHGDTYKFDIAEDHRSADCFKGSKYVKSDMGGIYHKVSKLLRDGRRVLFVGLPCQCAAMKRFVGREQGNLYIVDLICHGTPSPEFLKQYFVEKRVYLKNNDKVSFRESDCYGLAIDGEKVTPANVIDAYTLAFLEGLSFTANCYSCKFASVSRVSDLTLGDSWGSTLSEDEQKKGISLILAQTDKGRELLAEASLITFPVNIFDAMKHNAQLNGPVQRPKSRAAFHWLIDKGLGFRLSVFFCLPKRSIKQLIKLTIARILHRSV